MAAMMTGSPRRASSAEALARLPSDVLDRPGGGAAAAAAAAGPCVSSSLGLNDFLPPPAPVGGGGGGVVTAAQLAEWEDFVCELEAGGPRQKLYVHCETAAVTFAPASIYHQAARNELARAWGDAARAQWAETELKLVPAPAPGPIPGHDGWEIIEYGTPDGIRELYVNPAEQLTAYAPPFWTEAEKWAGAARWTRSKQRTAAAAVV